MRSKTELNQLFILLFMFIIVGCNLFTNKNQNNISFETFSGPLTKTQYEILMQKYKDGQINTHQFYTKGKILEGLVFDADQIRKMLDENQNASGERPNSLILNFGYDDKANEWHVILVGRNHGKLLNFDKNDINNHGTTNISVYDKAHPCPPCSD